MNNPVNDNHDPGKGVAGVAIITIHSQEEQFHFYGIETMSFGASTIPIEYEK